MAMRTREPATDQLSDSELAGRAATGEIEAFASLYRRHADAAWRVAQAVAGNADDAADAVSEAFSRLLANMAQGRVDPAVPFRPYLLVTTRNAAIDTLRRHKRVDNVDLTALDRPTPLSGPSERMVEGVDAALVATAFRGLPERWRSVLWLTAVEGMSAREVGERLGLSANGAAQLAVRARNGLRERYLQAHLMTTEADNCRDTVEQLGAYAAGQLSPKAIAGVDQHLAGCETCRQKLAEIEDVESGLRRILLPLPALLAPAALERFRTAMSGTGHATHSLLLGGERTTRMAGLMWRPLVSVTSGMLALGVITAAVLGGAGTQTGPVALAHPSPLAPTQAPALNALATAPVAQPAGATSNGSVALGPVIDTEVAVVTTSSAQDQPGVPTAVRSSTPAPPPPPPRPAAPVPTAKPLAQVALGANVSVTSASVAIGLGSGSCTGVSIGGSASCAPKAPATPGLSVSVSTPLGTISAGPLR
ncbi:MAG TPA: sigma-70 family RNA polymerase sigma factor [Acidimicrobiales bacterium]|nr:sigma-70 family RNA polymerase sigma factor [Acidimicrobiales bacterium]